MSKPSFSSATKLELARFHFCSRPALLAEIAAFAFSCGAISLGRGKMKLELSSEHEPVAIRMVTILKILYGSAPIVEMHTHTQPKKTTLFDLTIDPALPEGRLLFDMGLLIGTRKDYQFGELNASLFRQEGCFEASVRGAFLGCGVLCDPNKNYQLEFVLQNEQFAQFLAASITEKEINAKIFRRGERFVLYLKSVEHILDLLVLAGAHATMLEMENVRVVKEVRNTINRHGNCDLANLEKMAAASAKQRADILLIEKELGFEQLPPSLREACELRLEHEDSSLAELSEISGTATRSALNKRFTKIHEIAESLRGGKP